MKIAKFVNALFSIILSIAKIYYLMSLHLQMCSLSYKGYPRGVEGTPDDGMMVSAIMNVLALLFASCSKGFSRGSPVFLPPQKPIATLQIPIRSRNEGHGFVSFAVKCYPH